MVLKIPNNSKLQQVNTTSNKVTAEVSHFSLPQAKYLPQGKEEEDFIMLQIYLHLATIMDP